MFFIFKYKYAVIGSDLRQVILLQELEKEESCIFYDVERRKNNCLEIEKRRGEARKAQNLEEAVTQAENLLFPIPFCKEKNLNLSSAKEMSAKDLLDLLIPSQRLLAGSIDKEFVKKTAERGVVCRDYMAEESIALYNSIATAEGTIGEILQSFPYNLHGTPVLVLGYGRCAKVLVRKLKALDAKVSVYARREEPRMEAYAQGAATIRKEELLEEMKKYPVIINTIPDRLFKKEDLEKIHQRTGVYEIASYPYCMDPQEAKKRGIRFQICPSLPGKYSPMSSAMILKEYILENCREESKEKK